MINFQNISPDIKKLLLWGLGITAFILIFKSSDKITTATEIAKNFDASALPDSLKPPKLLKEGEEKPKPYVKFCGFTSKPRFETFY